MTTPTGRTRASATTTLVVAASLAAFVASFAPSIRGARGPTVRVLVHDASASCGARAAPDDDELAALVDGLGDDDLVAVVSFGEDVVVSADSCKPSDLPRSQRSRTIDERGSSLGNALRVAASFSRDKPRFEVVLATDGLSTDAPSRLDEAIAELRVARCASLRVLRRAPVATASRLSELRGPGAARVGEPFALEARGVARTDDAVVELRDARGAVVETRRVRGAGRFRVAFTRIEETAGGARYTARVAGDDDSVARAHVAVGAPGRVLVLGAARRAIPGLDAATTDFTDGPVVGSSGVETALFGAHDAVVFDDVSSARLDGVAVGALRAWVERGGGIVLLGGPRSFGAGGWAGRDIESLSPLVARPKDDSGTFLYLALDGSGSMAQPWSDAAGAATRDDVVRSAAERLAMSAGDGTAIAVRRFTYELKPAGVPVVAYRVGAGERHMLPEVIGALATPGGSTALLPPLREALTLAASRTEKRRRALILTDGRTSERAEDLHAALLALDAAHVGVTFVLPGDAALDDEARALRDAIVGTKAEVRGATSPTLLADVFRDVEEKARVDEPVVADQRLVVAPDAAPLVDVAPDVAARIDRAWLADGARALVVTDKGEPVAAVRRVGLGTATALATKPGDPEWLADGERTARLVASLVRAATRPAAGRLRVERDGDARLLVRYEPPAGGAAAASVAVGDVRAPLVPADGGLVAAELPLGRATSVDVLAADGRVLATAGLDEPAPAEYRDPPAVDLDALASLAVGAPAHAETSLLPWLAASAVLLAFAGVAAASVKSRAPPAR